MKEQTDHPMGIYQEPSAFDACYLVLPLIMAVAISFCLALLPTEWVFGFFGLLIFVGLLVALTHHT